MSLSISLSIELKSKIVAGDFLAFRNRVIADGGTIETTTETEAEIRRLHKLGLYDDDLTLAYVAGAYKASKWYNIKNASGDLDVVRSTNGTRQNRAGLIDTLGNNLTRADYDAGVLKGNWVESAATNGYIHSNDMTAQVAGANITKSAESIKGLNGLRITQASGTTGAITSANDKCVVTFTATINENSRFVYSGYLNASASKQMEFRVGWTLSSTVLVDCQTQTITDNTSSGYTLVDSVLNDLGNDVFYFELRLQRIGSGSVASLQSDFAVPVLEGSIGIAGYQIEMGNVASTNILTSGTTATRNADNISKTGISGLIGQTEGVIYAEVNVTKLLGTQARYILNISDGTTNNRLYIAFSGSSSNILRARVFASNVLQTTIDTSTISALGTYKVAIAYANNDVVFYVNGAQIGTATTVTIPECSKVNVGTSQSNLAHFNDPISRALVFKKRLTNEKLIQLTKL